MSVLDFQMKLNAAQQCDEKFDGIFYLAVKSTGIFCLPSCRAKFPKLRNIEFFNTKDDALIAGYRGCKRCYSAQYPDTQPTWLQELIKFIDKSSTERLTISDFENFTNKPIITIRRYFKTHFKISPSQYHRKIQLKYARKQIEKGEDYRDIAFVCGYESISGFRNAFFNQFGFNPGAVR